VPIYVFGDRMDDNVRAVVERGLDVGAQESIIHHDHYAVLVSYRCDFPNID